MLEIWESLRYGVGDMTSASKAFEKVNDYYALSPIDPIQWTHDDNMLQSDLIMI